MTDLICAGLFTLAFVLAGPVMILMSAVIGLFFKPDPKRYGKFQSRWKRESNA